jgi:dihydrofolate reductase
MRRLCWQMMVTLDGFMAGPNGELDWHVVDEDFMKYALDMRNSMDTMLFGRVTYQMMADYWPSSTQPEALMMNDFPKIVFSRTLTKAEWKNSRLVKENIGEEVAKLKQQSGKEIVLIGSANLASTFTRLGLIDEYRIFVNPVVLGTGQATFKDIKDRVALRLVKTQTLRSGVVLLNYQPA